jgi:hypothetical protein
MGRPSASRRRRGVSAGVSRSASSDSVYKFCVQIQIRHELLPPQCSQSHVPARPRGLCLVSPCRPTRPDLALALVSSRVGLAAMFLYRPPAPEAPASIAAAGGCAHLHLARVLAHPARHGWPATLMRGSGSATLTAAAVARTHTCVRACAQRTPLTLHTQHEIHTGACRHARRGTTRGPQSTRKHSQPPSQTPPHMQHAPRHTAAPQRGGPTRTPTAGSQPIERTLQHERARGGSHGHALPMHLRSLGGAPARHASRAKGHGPNPYGMGHAHAPQSEPRNARTDTPQRSPPPLPASPSTQRLRGGVSGRELPPKSAFCFSAGLRMRKEHMSDSSIAMTAPALSNSPQ